MEQYLLGSGEGYSVREHGVAILYGEVASEGPWTEYSFHCRWHRPGIGTDQKHAGRWQHGELTCKPQQSDSNYTTI